MGIVDACKICALDIETTGLAKPTTNQSVADEIVQLAIVAEDHSVSYNQFFQPLRIDSLPKTLAVNNIPTSSLREEPLFHEQKQKIQTILNQYSLIVAYNVAFDIAFLTHQGIDLKNKALFCMMQAFSRYRFVLNPNRRIQRRYTLRQCADYFGIKPWGEEHDALADAHTVLSCYQALCNVLSNSLEEEV
ncbi:MAG: 3'-5' exonuclease [Coriobacteriia bacterium]|nr:3'-5' exonuclease [Coriobacteriia bacterium]